jgi:hypothetical protein
VLRRPRAHVRTIQGVLLLTLGVLASTPMAAHAQAAAPASSGFPDGAEPAVPSEAAEPARPADRPFPFSLRWGPERLGLIRYNRVEGLSLGGRAAALPLGLGSPLRAALTVRLGWSGPVPSGRLDVERVTLRRSVGLAIYSEVTAADPASDPLGPLASVLALVAGRDDGDYYRRSGGALWWGSPPGSPARFRVGAHTARHEALSTATRLALPRVWDDSWHYRPNMTADEGWEHGLEASLAVALGKDPRRLQGRVELSGLAATGASEFTRGAAVARMVVPLPGGFRMDLEGSGGGSTGVVSEQRLWALGGPATVRGYPPRARVGGCFWRLRAEWARTVSFADFVAFSDVGNANPCGGEPAAGGAGLVAGDDPLASLGGGVFLLDRVIRISAGWSLDGRSSRIDVVLVGAG